MSTPLITIFVRHSEDCKYSGDEFSKRCQCRKHLRWTANGVQHRHKAGTRSWTEAEAVKRRLEDQLAGRTPEPEQNGKLIAEAVEVFIKEKTAQGVTDDVVKKYTRLLERLRAFCETQNVYTVEGINREVLTEFCSTWERDYPSSITRSKLRERLRSFLRYCFEAEWLDRVPPVTKFKIVEPETQPLTPEEYERLLAAVRPAIVQGDPRRETDKASAQGRRTFQAEDDLVTVVRAFLQTMRWTGLAIRDTLTLRRAALVLKGDVYSVVTRRAKTGTHVSVPVTPEVAAEMLKAHALNSNPEFFFWTGNGNPQSATSNWGQRYIAPCFKLAGIVSEGNMLSHRLRDTFAVDLLEKGVPMEEVSKALGHDSIRTTERHYAKWNKGRQDRLNALITGTWKKD